MKRFILLTNIVIYITNMSYISPINLCKIFMKRVRLILILLLVFIGNIQAQRDYRNGYIVTNDLDTVYGWIDYRGDIRNSKVCSFRKNETDKAIDFAPGDIAAYRFIDSKYYVSKDIDTENNPKTVFLEYLVNGMANLYYYRENNINNHYYIEKDGRIIELKTEERIVTAGDILFTQTVRLYIEMLKSTFNALEMNNKIDKVKLEHESLIDIVRDYHLYACTDGSECIVYEKKKPLIAMRIGPVIGGNLSYPKNMYFAKKEYDFQPSFNFGGGINLNLSMPRLNEKIFLQMQLLYTGYYFFGTLQNDEKSESAHFRANVLQIGTALKYEYPKGRWRPTIAIGGAAIYLHGSSIKTITDSFDQGSIRASTVLSDVPSKFMYGFELSPGIHYYYSKRIVFLQFQYLRYYYRKNVGLPASKLQSYCLSAGFYF